MPRRTNVCDFAARGLVAGIKRLKPASAIVPGDIFEDGAALTARYDPHDKVRKLQISINVPRCAGSETAPGQFVAQGKPRHRRPGGTRNGIFSLRKNADRECVIVTAARGGKRQIFKPQ